jgi:hypothetical protein
MSDRTMDDLDDLIARRLISALDALPVPAGPARLRVPTARQDKQLLVFAAVVFLLLVAFSMEPVRDAASRGIELIQRAIFGPPWTSYYITVGPSSGGGPRTNQLRFALGALPGIDSRPPMERQNVLVGTWSADGELVAIDDYTAKVYVGDRLGSVRQVADIGPAYQSVLPRLTWVGPLALAAVVRAPSGRWGLARIDVVTGTVDIHPLATPVVRRDDPLGQVFTWVSPDARWIALTLEPGGCGEITALYEVATDRIIPVVDADGRPAYAAGWLPDGRLVSASCGAGRVDIFVTAPSVRPDRAIATLPLTANSPQFAFDHVSDRFLVFNEDPTKESVVTILDSTGRVVRTARVPALSPRAYFSPLGGWFAMALSRDAKFFSVRILEVGPRTASDPPLLSLLFEQNGTTLVGHSAVVELETGAFTFACDPGRVNEPGCVQMVLR